MVRCTTLNLRLSLENFRKKNASSPKGTKRVRYTTLKFFVRKTLLFFKYGNISKNIRYPSQITVATVPAYLQKAFGGLSQNHSICALDRSSHLWKSSHRFAEQKYTYLLFLLTDLQQSLIVYYNIANNVNCQAFFNKVRYFLKRNPPISDYHPFLIELLHLYPFVKSQYCDDLIYL